jgi:hypothetical protein
MSRQKIESDPFFRSVGPPYASSKGNPTRRMTPMAGNSVFGGPRDPNSFLMHGDSIANPGHASKGCLITPPWMRALIPNGETVYATAVR